MMEETNTLDKILKNIKKQPTKRQATKLKKLARAALDTSDEPELNKVAVDLIKLGYLEDEGHEEETELERFKRLMTLKQELRAESTRIARTVFDARAQEMFAKDPDLESFGWRQATPTETQEYNHAGFMIVHAETPIINGVEQDWRSPRDQDGTAGSVRRTLAYLFWNTELEDMFGDGREITVQRDGTVTSEYWRPPEW